MSRSFMLVATGLLVAGTVFGWRSSPADDTGNSVTTAQTEDMSKVVDLVDRIEILEKRLALLEKEEPVIRQADNREMAPPVRIRSKRDEDLSDEEVDETQKTNGQPWSFRLLGHRVSEWH